MNGSPGPEQGVALVTGATGGLGRALVELLAQRGYRVIAAARNPDRLPGIAGVTSLRLDVTDRRSVRVIGVYPGPIDTAMAADLPEPKEPRSAVALAVVDALEGGQDEVFPGAVAQDLGAAWRANPKALETLFAGTN